MVLEKYLTMWDPVNFVTRNELREYLKSKGVKIGADTTKDENAEEN